jgi:diketogulonate reductase-like aldo/keto reductase
MTWAVSTIHLTLLKRPTYSIFLIEAFSPIATGALIKNAAVGRIAEKYGKSVPQLCIRYVLQKGTVALPKTTHREYMLQNAQTDFEITPEDMQVLDMIKDPVE